MGHRFVIETAGRHAARSLRREQLTAAHSLFRHARSGRYFGGLWFKIFTERGPAETPRRAGRRGASRSARTRRPLTAPPPLEDHLRRGPP